MKRVKQQLTFNTPRELLRFFSDCLKHGDIDRLFGAAMEAASDFWRERMFRDLREIEASETLESVFLVDDDFPNLETAYKLGGHGNRTRHLHIDLVHVEGAWRLKKIWKCR